jgi:hypothetical protein
VLKLSLNAVVVKLVIGKKVGAVAGAAFLLKEVIAF